MRLVPRHVPPAATPLDFRLWRQSRPADPAALPDFAAALAASVGMTQAWTASSGRTALRLVLSMLRAQVANSARREVTLPGYTCPSVAKVVIDAGLIPRLVDIDPATLDYVPAALQQAVSSQTLAVMCVHPFGLPGDIALAQAAAQAVGAWVVEDAAQALGAAVGETPVGTVGDVGLYSFGPGKPLALGGGGALVTRQPDLAAALTATWADLPPSTRATGRWAWVRMGIFGLAFQPPLWWLANRLGAQRVGDNEASWGYTMRGLTAPQAAYGLATLPRLAAFNQARIRHAQAWTAAMCDLPGVTLVRSGAAQAHPIYLRLPLLAATNAQADHLVRELNRAGIGAGRVYRRTLAEFFPEVSAPPLPGAEQVARTLVTLPTNHHLTAADLPRTVDLIRRMAARPDLR